MKKYIIELDVHMGEWRDEMIIQCDDFKYIDNGTIKVNGAIVKIPEICEIISYKEEVI